MRFTFDIEFDLELLILAICTIYTTSKIVDIFSKPTEPWKMHEPEHINLDEVNLH